LVGFDIGVGKGLRENGSGRIAGRGRISDGGLSDRGGNRRGLLGGFARALGFDGLCRRAEVVLLGACLPLDEPLPP
jgi:hypothetical protein